MKWKFLLTLLFISVTGFVYGQEYDDLYFNGNDREYYELKIQSKKSYQLKRQNPDKSITQPVKLSYKYTHYNYFVDPYLYSYNSYFFYYDWYYFSKPLYTFHFYNYQWYYHYWYMDRWGYFYTRPPYKPYRPIYVHVNDYNNNVKENNTRITTGPQRRPSTINHNINRDNDNSYRRNVNIMNDNRTRQRQNNSFNNYNRNTQQRTNQQQIRPRRTYQSPSRSTNSNRSSGYSPRTIPQNRSRRP